MFMDVRYLGTYVWESLVPKIVNETPEWRGSIHHSDQVLIE